MRSALEDVCARIRENRIDVRWCERARGRLDSLTKPLGSLGKFEDLAAQFVTATEEARPAVRNPAVYVFAADHGVAHEGVSAYPAEVTAQMVKNFIAGGAAVNVLARGAAMDVIVVDVGVESELEPAAGLVKRKVRRGTRNFLSEPAMSEAELWAALEVGFEQGSGARAAQRNLVIAGEMGIGNTTATAAINAALTGAAAREVTGRGTGLDDSGVVRKAAVIENALARHFGTLRGAELPALEVLRCVGGLEIAAMVGFILKAVSERLVVVVDGFISTAAAAIAYAIAPEVKPFLIAGHESTEIGHKILLSYLGLDPLLRIGMRLGEGTGAVVATMLIRSALQLYNEMATFESARISGASA